MPDVGALEAIEPQAAPYALHTEIGALRAIHPPRRLRSHPTRPLGGVVKRAGDIVLSALALIVLAIPFLIVAAAIKLDSSGPILFLQRRGGFRGRPFLVMKFRTMSVTEDGRDVAQAVRGDPRVTRVGALLRKSCIDELPQLFNVLRGEMSLVGPRPHAVAHDSAFRRVDRRYGRRFKARPGLTGLAQVNGCRGLTRDDEDVRRRVSWDMRYIDTWSPVLDLWIMLRTVFVLLRNPNRVPVRDAHPAAVGAHAPEVDADASSPPLTVVHVITRFIRGGADENTLLSCNAQAEAGHNVVLVFGEDHHAAMCGRLDPRVRQVCLPSLVRPIRPVKDIRALFELVACLRELRPNIVHTHTSKAGILGRCAAHIAQVDAIVHGVHILPFVNVGRLERAVYLTLERLLDPLTDAFVDVSGEMRDVCVREHVGAPDAHVVVPSGMNIERFREAQPLTEAEIRRALGLSDDAEVQLVVMAAALEPRKRVVEFLPVFRDVVRRCPNARLAILGEGVERLRALDQIEALGLEGHVSLLGFREDVERWIAAAEVCVLASEREGLPRAVVQYVLAARPCVVTALPGIGAVVQEGRNGYVTAEDDLDEMITPIVNLLRRPMLRTQFSEFSRSLNLSDWSDRNMTAALEDVYRRVLDETRLPPTGEHTWIS